MEVNIIANIFEMRMKRTPQEDCEWAPSYEITKEKGFLEL